MGKETLTLTYLNEDDRAYGLAGMTVTLAALDALDKISEVTLDTDGPMITFEQSYYISSSGSPKATWDNLVRNFHLTSAIILSNVMARSVVRLKKDVPTSLLNEVRKAIADEGKETCSLEDDEIDDLYRRTLSYTRRLFNNPQLKPAIAQFAGVLSRKRTLTAVELRDELERLSII